MNIRELHQRALEAARKYFSAEADLLELIQKIDACRGFRSLGHASLFSYAVGELKLSENVALNLINVARKAVQIPALKAEIRAGTLSVCKARKIVPVLTTQNQVEWIEKAKKLPTRKLEQEIAKVAPGEACPERVRYVSENRMTLSLSLDEKIFETIKRIQDLESQKKNRAVSLEETFAAMSAFYVEKNDPVEKAKRAVAKISATPSADKMAKDAPERSDVTRQIKRLPIPATTEHEVTQRDGARCTAIDPDGKRCPNRRWLHVHHIKPVNAGGGNALDNLATLCSAHHRMHHKEQFGSRVPARRARGPASQAAS